MMTEIILGLVLIVLLLGFQSMEERFDRIIELLEDLTKPKCKIKPSEVNVSFADGTTCEVEE